MAAQSDDSQTSAHYMRVTLALFIPVVALAIALPLLWNMSQRAQADSSSLDYALSQEEIASLAKTAGYEATGDDITSILVLVTSDDALESANLITVNDTQKTDTLLELNPAAYVTADNTAQALTSFYEVGSSAGVARAVAQAGIISVDHVVEMDTSSWNVFLEAVEQGSDDLSVDLEKLLEGIKENDMSVRTLREVFTRALSYGFSAHSIKQVSTTEQSDSSGASHLVLNQAEIGLTAGTIK